MRFTPPPPREGIRAAGLLFALVASAGVAACSPASRNPSFDVTLDAAEDDLERMEREPVRLQRPVVVIGGFADPIGLGPGRLARRLREVTGDNRVLAVSMGGVVTFDGARAKTIDAIQKAFPSADPSTTTEVDVVGFSMGGLVARDAALPADEDNAEGSLGGRRLRIVRLFTIATPHRGASSAVLPLGPLVRDMSPGSDFLAALADARRDMGYTSYHYVRLDDHIVGEANAAPDGQAPWWVPAPALQMSHAHAYKDARIVADIARRLRGETPLTSEPPAPLPADD